MFEHQTYEAILQRMLARVPAAVDRREGSIIYNALAPAAAELAQAYISLDAAVELTYADGAATAGDMEHLERRVQELGITRKPATAAQRLGEFWADATMTTPFAGNLLGSRWSAGGINYTAAEQLATGQWRMTCETAGRVGNDPAGELLPLEYHAGLAVAELTDILIPGQDAESAESLYARYQDRAGERPFAGNIAGYQEFLRAQPGVGGAKVYPAWAGGGTVKALLIDSEYLPAGQALVDAVQETVDPLDQQGDGIGMAPINHVVTVAPVGGAEIAVALQISTATGVTPEQLQQPITEAVEVYLLELRKEWANAQRATIPSVLPQAQRCVVRPALIIARVLGVSGVVDVLEVLVNGQAGNIELPSDQVPILSEVVVSGP